MTRNSYNRSAEVIARPSGPSHEELACLEKCLESLEPAQREMLLQYYGARKTERAEQAKGLGLTLTQLRIRCFKIRPQLRQCMFKCLQEIEENTLPL